MIGTLVALLLSFAYLALLFGIANYGDRSAARGDTLIGSPLVYTLSLAVYCSAWTFFGSVGLAAEAGVAFLPIYLGPTVVAVLFPILHGKILTIAKAYGITSIADFIAARYGKSSLLGGLVTLVTVLGTIPYISLQLKAVANSLDTIFAASLDQQANGPVPEPALIVTLVLAAFSILFGTRHIDATEHHEGMVLAIAFESLVKLAAFIAVGLFVTYGMFDGFGDIFGRLVEGGRGELLTFGATGLGYVDWVTYTLLAALAFLALPRQFQVAVIENVDKDHLRTATWMFPLYLLAINIFVLPVAMAGAVLGRGGDTLMLDLPLAAGSQTFALVAYIGGLSAATAMVIVATIAVSTMISNDLVMPALLRVERLRLGQRHDLSALVLAIRRAAIFLQLLAGYAFFRLVAERIELVSIGLISFAAIAQLAPLILFGLFWRQASLTGALWGLTAGFAVWFFTLILPALVFAGWLDPAILEEGLFGLSLLRPQALFGLEGLTPVTHAVLWSLGANTLLMVVGSLATRPSDLGRLQAILFVDVEQRQSSTRLWRGETRVAALQDLLVRFLGRERAVRVFAREALRRGRSLRAGDRADAELVQLAERQLARAIGATSARLMVASIVRGEVIGPDALLEILDETSQAIEYSQKLEQKSRELERLTDELRRANERLRQLDQLKDDFIATVSHELRTPLTSIRSFSEILLDNPELPAEQQRHFVDIIARESQRLTRLIDDVLDLSKIESGRMEWEVADHDLRRIVEEAVGASEGLMRESGIQVTVEYGVRRAPVRCDGDRITQVMLNLLSNAAKFVPVRGGRIRVELRGLGSEFLVRVEDNGPGVPPPMREAIFEKFRQIGGSMKDKPHGTGLGLAICREIVQHFDGRIWCEEGQLGGAAICFTLPVREAELRAAE